MNENSLKHYLATGEVKPTEDAAPFSPAEYVAEFKEYFGYKDDYNQTGTYRKIRDSIAGECAMRAPYDTAARETDGDAVMALVMSGDPEGVEAGKNLGDCMMKKGKHDQETLLKRMSEAYKALLSLPDDEQIAVAQDAAISKYLAATNQEAAK